MTLRSPLRGRYAVDGSHTEKVNKRKWCRSWLAARVSDLLVSQCCGCSRSGHWSQCPSWPTTCERKRAPAKIIQWSGATLSFLSLYYVRTTHEQRELCVVTGQIKDKKTKNYHWTACRLFLWFLCMRSSRWVLCALATVGVLSKTIHFVTRPQANATTSWS